MLKALLIHLFRLACVAGFAMIVPLGFVWMLAGLPMDNDTSDFVRIFGTVLAPFGMALWSVAIWRGRSRPWLAFCITIAVLLCCIKLGVYNLEIR